MDDPYVDIDQYFDELDVRWAENKEIVKGMCVKTMKSIVETGKMKVFMLSDNWEEDQDFLIGLFEDTIDLDPEIRSSIGAKLKNWEMDRVALVDQVILEMGVVEMIRFPKIPIKVTINESIELTKAYSTPKSKVFVNGVLDRLSKELVKNGIIKKSGKGLLDNK